MTCPKCGATIQASATACPFCSADTSPATPPAMPPSAPPAAPAFSPPPVGTPPPQFHTPPPFAAPVGPPLVAPTTRRSSPVVAFVVLGCLGLLIIGGLGGFLAWKKFAGKLTTKPNVAVAADPTQETPDATGPAAQGATQPSDSGTVSLNLDDFVGTWEFIGEPGPWGEGMPVKLERVGNLMTGEVEVPEPYDEQIQLKLTAGNGELVGESTITDKDASPRHNAVTMELNAGKNIMTVGFRTDSGEWLVRVAEKKSGASPGGTSSAAPSGEAEGLRRLIVAASKLQPPSDGVQIETSGDWAFADVTEQDNKGNCSAATSVIARRTSGRWSVVMVGDPMENREITAQMPADVRKAYDKWDSGHY